MVARSLSTRHVQWNPVPRALAVLVAVAVVATVVAVAAPVVVATVVVVLLVAVAAATAVVTAAATKRSLAQHNRPLGAYLFLAARFIWRRSRR